MTKPRSDSVLLNLPEDQQEQICQWLLHGVEKDEGRDTSYKAVCAAIFNDLGVKTSETALAGFYRQVVAPRRLRTAAAAADHFVSEAQAQGYSFSAAAELAVRQKLFEISAADTVSPKELLAFAAVVGDFNRGELKRRDQALKEQDLALKTRRIELLERQAAEASEILDDTKLSAAEQAQRLREIFKR